MSEEQRPPEDLESTVSADLSGQGPQGTISRYRLLQKIGEGGMGEVWLADQQEPVRRRVAVKIIKRGMDTKQVVARFEAERQALAMMNHPNIAKVFDAGATPQGRPYFVMEYVKGVQINEHCDRQRLTTEERLELFTQVCAGVQHAHQKAIIHRDLKPSNVLVTIQDEKAVPKIIDFGVAKAIEQRLTEHTLFTELGQVVGTPEYMSPEQAEMTQQDIDTRTDVYSLGVMLYELLVGALPFDPKELRKAGFDEIRRRIREEEPSRPSTRISTLGEAASASARSRHTDLSTLVRQLRGDLDWITMKALEKDRTRRYETASGLAMDIKHHLAHEPVLAGPPGVTYRFRKFIKRNRVTVTAGAVVATALVLGLVLSTVGFVQANRGRRRAVAAEQQAQRQAYVANIAAAEAAVARNEVGKARRCLEAAPLEFRNWEWRYLNAETDDSVAVLRGHEGTIWSMVISPQGTYVASASRDKTVRIWDTATSEELAILRGHEEEVSSLAFNPAGTLLISGSADKTVRLWSVPAGEELATLRGHEAGITVVAFGPHGDLLASGSDDTTVRLWSVSTREEVYVFNGHGSSVYDIAFSPDGTRLASASWDTTVRLWDPFTGKGTAVLSGHEAGAARVTFSPDGARVASGSYDGTVRLWDAFTGDELAVLQEHEATVCSVAFNSDGTRLASGSWDSTARLWDPATGKGLFVLRGHDDRVFVVTFSPDDARLVSASADSTLRSWDTVTGNQMHTLIGHESVVWDVGFGPDGTWMASSSWDGTVRLWDASDEGGVSILRGHERFVESVAFSPDGTRLASAARDKTVRLWDVSTGKQLAVLRGHDDEVFSVAFSPDGTRLASGSLDKTVRLWEAFTGEELAVLRGHEDWVWEVAFSPNGSQVGSASRDKTVRIWNAVTGEELAVLGHESWVSVVTFSPDGSRLASGGDEVVRLWDVSTGEELAVLEGVGWKVNSLAFNPDGSRLASASKDVRLWDPVTGQELTVLEGSAGGAWAVEFSPDGTRLASGSRGYNVRLWDTSTGQELVVLPGHESSVVALAFSPDGTRLASASHDKTVRLWDCVPNRVRFRERQAILTARPDAERIVDRLWQQSIDTKSIVEWVREDPSLSEPQRRAALNLLLTKSVELRDRVLGVFAQLVFTDDVVVALETDDSLTPGPRFRAIRMARSIGDTPLRLNSDSWSLVRSAGIDPAAYQVALRGAEAAVAAEPKNLSFLTTLGVAQYRASQYEKAGETLNHCDDLRLQQGRKSVPPDLAVLSMAMLKMGRIQDALAVFERLERVMDDHEEGLRYYDAEAVRWFEESSQLFEEADLQTDAEDYGNTTARSGEVRRDGD